MLDSVEGAEIIYLYRWKLSGFILADIEGAIYEP